MKLDISNTMLLSWETEMQSKEVEFIVGFFFLEVIHSLTAVCLSVE